MSQAILTQMRDDLKYQLNDVEMLMAAYDVGSRDAVEGGYVEDLDVFLRAGIILIVSAWENYIEDMISDAFTRKLAKPTNQGDWKQMIEDSFRDDLKKFNTPKSENIRKITRKYLELDLTQSWKWENTSAKVACEKLDELIMLRHSLVHKPTSFYKSSSLKRQGVEEAMQLIYALSECTDESLQPEPMQHIALISRQNPNSDNSL